MAGPLPPTFTGEGEGVLFAVHTDDPELADIVARQLRGFATSTPNATSAAPTITYDISRPPDDGVDHLWTMRVRRQLVHDDVVTAPTAAYALDALVDRIDRDLLDATPDRLHMHAAAVRRGDRVVVALGPSRAGKSTLASTLAGRGFTYLTDEMVSVGDTGGALEISWVAKPIGVRLDAAERLGVASDGAGEVVRGVHVFHVAPPAAGPCDRVHPGLLVTLHRQNDDGGAQLVDGHPADLTVAILEHSFDATRLGERALLLAARLSLASRCGQLRYDEATDVVALVERELAVTIESSPPRSTHPVGAPHLLADARAAAGPGRSVDTASVWVDDRVVVLHVPTRQVVALDPAVSHLWELFDGRATLAELARELGDESRGDVELITERLAATVDDLRRHLLVDGPVP